MRQEDERLEKVLAEYLDRNLYTYQNGFYDVDRKGITKELNIKGVDIQVDDMLIDEKMATSYINKDLQTYSLELMFLNRKGKETKGWLLKEDSLTTHYVLGWITAKKDKNISLSDILYVEIVLLDKKKIKAFVAENIDLNKVEKLYELKQNTDFRNGFKLVHSKHLVEKPFNIIVTKEKYIELADKHLIV